MALTQKNSYGVGNTDLTNLMGTVDMQRRGYINVTLTEMTSLLVPAVAVGSALDSDGALISAVTEQAIGGTPTAGEVNYIKISSLVPTWTTTDPTWSSAKGGWYDGNERYIGGCYYDGTYYTSKFVYDMEGYGFELNRV